MVIEMRRDSLSRNLPMLKGPLAKKGYDWWWHCFTAKHEKTYKEKAFYIEYYYTNPQVSPNKVILGQSGKDAIPSYFMMNVGTWGKDHRQIHEFYPIKDMEFTPNLLELKIGPNYLSETKIKGKCKATIEQASNPAYMTDAGSLEWDLDVNKLIEFNVGYGASKPIRKLNAFEMFWHAQGIKTEYKGYVILDGEKYIVEPNTSYGYADKNWGKDFTSPWLWISSSNIKSIKNKRKLNNTAIELGGGRPKVFGIPFNKRILIMIHYEGEEIEFNFSKFWKYSKVEFEFNEVGEYAVWDVAAENRKYKINLNLKCKLNEMLEINYEAPNGKKRHNHLLNGGNGFGTLQIYDKNNILIDNLEFYNTGCEYGEYDY